MDYYQPSRFSTTLTSIYIAICLSSMISTKVANAENNTASCIFNSSGSPGGTCPVTTPTVLSGNSVVSTAVGNPIDALTGNKFQQEHDIQTTGDTYALRLNRYYNSQSKQLGIFGYGWRSDYEMQLQDIDGQIDIIQADGRQYHFYKTTTTDPKTNLTYIRYQTKNPSLGYVERTNQSDPTKPLWQWQLPSGKRFQFIAHKQVNAITQTGTYRFGQLATVTENPSQANSPYWELTYDTLGRLAQVRNQTGDTLKFNYSTTQYKLPKIEVISKSGITHYFLNKDNNLTQVVSSTGERTGYEYKDKDIHNLTAKLTYDKAGKANLFAQWQYDDFDRAISSTHANGVEKVSIEYDKNTLLPKTTGQHFSNTITNSVGEKTVYEYRSTSNDFQLLSVKGAGCATCGEINVSYDYDQLGRLIATTHYTLGGQVASIDKISYDALGRIATEQTLYPDQANSTTAIIHYEYVTDDPTSTKRQLIAKKWQPSVFANQQTGMSYDYNEQGQLIKETQFGYTPDGKTLSRSLINSYDDKGNLYQVKRLDANSQTPITLITYTWFADGSLKKIEQPLLKQATEFTHNEFGLTTQIKRVVNDKSLAFKIGYDANHRPISLSRYEQDKLINGVKYQRNATGKITSVTDLDGKFVASYVYDAADRMLGELTKQKVSISHFDTESRPIVDYQITAQNTDKLSYRYDDKGRITGAGRDDKQLVAVNYSPDGKTAQIMGASGQQYIEHLDAQQSIDYQLPNTWDALGVSATQVSYPANGIARINQNNQIITDYGYDDFGRIAYIKHPSIGKNSYEYNNLDQLTQITLSDGRQIHYQYDAQGNRIQKQTLLANKLVNQVTWQYDTKGQLTQVKENNQQINYTYDDKGNVTKKQIQLVGLKNPLITQFDYDSDGQITQIILPDGISLASHNNEIGYRLPNQLASNILYRQNTVNIENNQKITYQLGDHINMSYLYDNEGRYAGLSYRAITQNDNNPLINAAHADNPTPLFSQQWQRDSNNIVQQVNEIDYQGKAKQQDYLYDSQYHVVSSTEQPIDLAKAVNSNPAQPDNSVNQARFIYDSLGNRLLGEDAGQPLKRYEYDELGRLRQIKGIGESQQAIQMIHYNQAGQPTEYGNWLMQYNAGNLTQVSDKSGQLVAQYTYNDEGQRIRKQVWVKDGNRLTIPETTYYVYEGSQLQHELDGQGNIIRNYVYVGNQLVATIDYDAKHHAIPQAKVSSWQRAKNWMSSLVSNDKNNAKVNYVISDYLGRPRQVRDGESNALVWQLSPTLFGGEANKGLEKKTGYQLNVRFPGQFEDVETGLYYNHWRYYDKGTGRYITPDPLGLAGGDNVYAYVNAAPTHFVDAPGLLLFAFDGTGNMDYTPKGGSTTYTSNVVKFRDVYQKETNEPSFPNTKWTGQIKSFDNALIKQNVFYISGAGTEDQYTGIGTNTIGNIIDSGIGESLPNRVDQMLIYFQNYLDKLIEKRQSEKDTNQITLKLDVVGFSRGAASARMFASKLNWLLGQDYSQRIAGYLPVIPPPVLHPSYQGTNTVSTVWKYGINNLCGINIQFNYLGLWDTVPAYGSSSLDDDTQLSKMHSSLQISGKWKRVAQAVALNEHRSGFPVRSIFNNQSDANAKNGTNRIERGFLGAHSDIGGGYAEGNLSNVALMWIINEARKAGVHFNESTITKNNYNTVNAPTVHDSVGTLGIEQFKPSRDLLWAKDNAKSISQFANIPHLGLTWKGTLDFENSRGGKKFSQIQQLSKDYSQTCTGSDCYVKLNAISKYMQLKDPNNNTILYRSGDAKQKILIDSYLSWINSHYGLILKSK